MKTYELTYIISPDASLDEAQAKAKEFEASIQSREGVVLKQSNPVAITLSYQIKKRASGFVGTIEFQLEPEKLVELEQIVRKDGKIVRHMLIIKEPARHKKERRGKREFVAPEIKIEHKAEKENNLEETQETPKEKAAEKSKVELKDIEQKLDEILGE